MENFVLITGASSGIGEQTVKLLINHGYSVLAALRTQKDADRLRSTYGDKVYPLLMDVTQDDQVDRAFEEATRIVGNNDFVAIINNAGIAVNGAVLYVPIDEWKTQFEINLFGVIRITQSFFPLLKKASPTNTHPRRIINISSVTGLFASPFLGPYASSKFALEAMSDALRRELFMYDIQVVLIEPGSIRTPIWTKAKEKPTYFGPEHEGILAFKDKVIEKNMQESLAPEAIDKVMVKAISGKRVKPRYIIKSGKWKFQLVRLLPATLVDKMIRKNLQSRSGIRPF